ncbi:MAG: hypothetical protein IJ892_05965, partial [Prevotella sp.]|nr:hypothetical protein [Prevotella sp.]
MFRFVILAAKLQQSVQTAKLFVRFFAYRAKKSDNPWHFAGDWPGLGGTKKKIPVTRHEQLGLILSTSEMPYSAAGASSASSTG